MADITDKLLASLTNVDSAVAKLDRTVDNLTDSLKTLVQQSSAATKGLQSYTNSLQVHEDIAFDEIMARKKHTQVTEDDIKLAKQLARIKKDIADEETHRQALLNSMATATADQQKSINAQVLSSDSKLAYLRKQQTAALKSSSIATTRFTQILKLAWKFIRATAVFLGGAALNEYMRHKDAMEATSGMLEKSLGPSFIEAREALDRYTFSHGLAYDEMLQSITSQRQAVNAMGGTTEALKQWTGDTKNQFTAMTGDVDKGFRLMLESQSHLRRHGFRPTADAMLKYGRDVQMLSALTGKTSAEMAGLYEEVASDTDSLVLLRAAREDERDAILASQRALINMNVAAGMTAEQAKEAAKMLNKMVAAKPLDRIKQAARIRALGGAMGIAGSEDAARAIMAGPRATAEQRRQLMAFSKSATGMVDQMRGLGLGQEIFATVLLEKLDLEQYYGAGSNFSDTLTTAMKNQAPDFANAVHDKSLKHMIQFQEKFNQGMAALAGQGLPQLSKISDTLDLIAHPLDRFFKGVGKFFLGEGTLLGWVSNLAASGRDAAIDAAAGGSEVEAMMKGKTAEATAKASQEAAKHQATAVALATEQRDASQAVSLGIASQLNLMNDSNDFLKKLFENSEKQVALAERQLVAATMSEKEKDVGVYRRRLLEGNPFVARYGMISSP